MHSPRPADPIWYRRSWVMRVRCRGCGREAARTVGQWAGRTDPRNNLMSVLLRMTCQECGEKNPAVVEP